jgi:hypothetical protein
VVVAPARRERGRRGGRSHPSGASALGPNRPSPELLEAISRSNRVASERTRERVGESEGRSPSGKTNGQDWPAYAGGARWRS